MHNYTLNTEQDISLLTRKIAEDLFPGIRFHVYKSSEAVIISYKPSKIDEKANVKNQLSVAFKEIEKYNGPVEQYLKKRINMFSGLYNFLCGVMPEIIFISEDEYSIGVNFKKKNNKGFLRLYYEKQLFSRFIETPEEIVKKFVKETEKRKQLLKKI